MIAKLLLVTAILVTLTGCPKQANANDPTKPKDEPGEFFKRTSKSPTEEPKKKDEKTTPVKATTLADEVGAVIRAELAPLVKEVGYLKQKTAELDEKIIRLEARRGSFEKETLKALSGVRADLDAMQDVVQALSTLVEEMKQRPPANDPPTGTKKGDSARLTAAVEKLTNKVNELDKVVANFGNAKEPPVPSPSPNWNVKRTVKLPCGLQLELVLPAQGTYVKCPKCGGLTFVKP
jgi:uncharacterized coiled-coil protein SlyX